MMQPPKSIFHKVVLVCSMLLFGNLLWAQKAVHFEDIGFDEAVQKAKAQKKIVFVDVRNMNPNAYTDRVEKEVFTVDSVADFFNAHCINIRINMGTEEGKKFAPRLAMLMYPVYVFHGSSGDQLDFTNAGSVIKDPALLMVKARASLATNRIKNANTRSITFTKGSWESVLQKAKASGKLVFLDAQTTWCRPCIMMAKDVFTLNRVADYYNEHFINVTMDMEKGEGPSLVKRYDVHAYPTFLYVDGNGKLVYRDGGYQEADSFLLAGRTAVSKLKGDSMGAGAGLQFTGGVWASILAKAKQSGKLIFVDANTSWCGPCKQMRKEIFPQAEVGQLYNTRFINVDMDMEKGEGPSLAKKFGVHAYPTFLYIDGDGRIVHKTVGSCDAAAFRQHGLDALDPQRNLFFMSRAYKSRLNDGDFIGKYLSALADASELKLADSVAVAYLSKKAAADWHQPANWQMIDKYVSDATSSPFLALVNEQAHFGDLFGQEVVEKKIYQTYLAWPQSYLRYPMTGAAYLDRAGFDAFLHQVNGSPYGKKAEIAARARLSVDFGLRDWHGYAAVVDSMLAAHIVPMDVKGAEWLYGFADIIHRFSGDDKGLLTAASRWARVSSTEIAGINPSDKVIYLDLYATLLEKTGRGDEAIPVRKNIDQQQLASSKQAAPFQTLTRIIPKQN